MDGLSSPRIPDGLWELDFGLAWLASQFDLDWRHDGSAENVLARTLNTGRLPPDRRSSLAVRGFHFTADDAPAGTQASGR